MSDTTFPRIERRITGPMIDAYGRLNGDRNLIHYDKASAEAAGFPDRVAHGAITVAVMHEACREYFGARWLTEGRLRVTFVAPVLVDETIVTGGRPSASLQGEAGQTHRVEVFCTKLDGTTVLVGEAECGGKD